MEELAIIQIRNPQLRKLSEFPTVENFIRYQNGVLDTIEEIRKLFLNATLLAEKKANKKREKID